MAQEKCDPGGAIYVMNGEGTSTDDGRGSGLPKEVALREAVSVQATVSSEASVKRRLRIVRRSGADDTRGQRSSNGSLVTRVLAQMPDPAKKYAPTGLALIVLGALGALALVVFNHQTYTKNGMQMADEFSADTVVLGIFAFLVAAAAAALAYPSYSEWKQQVWGPQKPQLSVGYYRGDQYADLDNAAVFNGLSIGHRLQVQVTNKSRVPLRDGQISIFMTFSQNTALSLVTPDGFKLISHARLADSPPGGTTFLLTLLEQFPASSQLYFVPEVRFGSTGSFGLDVIMTGSNLRRDRQYSRHWTLNVT